MIRAEDRRDDFEGLPILEEMRVSLADAYAREEAAEAAKAAKAARPVAPRRRRRRRRRLVVALAALVVVVPSAAVATRPIWAPTTPGIDERVPGTPAVGAVLAEGAGPSTRWRFSAFLRDGALCLQFATRGSTGFCRPPGVPIAAAMWEDQGDRYFVGATAPDIARVAVTPRPGAPAAVAATRAPDAERLRRFGIPAGFRFYVVRVDGSADPGRWAVRGYDGRGRETARFSPATG